MMWILLGSSRAAANPAIFGCNDRQMQVRGISIDCIVVVVVAMAPCKDPSPKKPPARRRRAKTMLGTSNEVSSYSHAAEVGAARVDVPATPAPKTSSLKLVMTSREKATPSLRLNGLKPPKQQRPLPVINSLLDLIQPSSPLLS